MFVGYVGMLKESEQVKTDVMMNDANRLELVMVWVTKNRTEIKKIINEV